VLRYSDGKTTNGKEPAVKIFARAAAILIGLLIGVLPNVAQAQSIAPALACQYELGFAALHALIPTTVGNCLENEGHNPVNGDGLQQTTGGLLVWRKSDNWTAFTDGYHTWINGPNGLQERLNSQRFPWEDQTVPTTLATVLDVRGSGIKTTQNFTVGSQWDLVWSYDCSSFGSKGNFIVNVLTPNGQSSSNVGTNQLRAEW